MRFIELTQENGDKILINVSEIASVGAGGRVWGRSDNTAPWRVRESYKSIRAALNGHTTDGIERAVMVPQDEVLDEEGSK